MWTIFTWVILAPFLLSSEPLQAQADSAITVRVAAPHVEAQARLTRAMMNEGLSIAGTSPGFVVGTGTEKKNTIEVRYGGVLLPADSTTDVTLSAVATAKARLMGAKVESRVTSKLKGGEEVWARLQRIAAQTAATPNSAAPAKDR